MVQEAIKRQIIEIVQRNIINLDSFKLHFFGYCPTNGNEVAVYDVGIEAMAPVSIDMLCKINIELGSMSLTRRIFMLDYNRIGSDLKEYVFDTEIVNGQKTN